MEYLLSGSKVVMYRLPGIPEEYYRYIRTIDGQDPQSMAEAINSAFRDMEFYAFRWYEQVNWIREKKSSSELVRQLMV